MNSTTNQSKLRKTILIAEDDMFATARLVAILEAEGFNTVRVGTGNQVLNAVKRYGDKLILVLLDIMMPHSDKPKSSDTHSENRTGHEIAQILKRSRPDLPVLGISNYRMLDVEQWFADYAAGFIIKPLDPRDIVNEIYRVLGMKWRRVKPKCFVVHGHDTTTLKEVVKYIKNDLGWEDVVLLREQAFLGRTIIEKFEDEAKRVDVVFVLLTPDDVVAPPDADDDVKRRARQNVVFEMGYFFAKLQRRSGNVILLFKGPMELPSDIYGVGYIDISAGIKKEGAELRRELKKWL